MNNEFEDAAERRRKLDGLGLSELVPPACASEPQRCGRLPPPGDIRNARKSGKALSEWAAARNEQLSKLRTQS